MSCADFAPGTTLACRNGTFPADVPAIQPAPLRFEISSSTIEVDELDRPEVVEAVDARADGGAARRVAYGGGEPRV